MAKKKKKSEEVFEVQDIEPKLYRWFTFVAYDESIHYEFNDILTNVMGIKIWAYIKHEPDEEIKQPHYHFIIYFDNAKTISSVSKRIGIPENHIKYIRNVRSMCRYLTHIDFPDKIQYSLSDVHISKLFDRKFKKHYEDIKTEEEIIQDIYYWIENTHFDNFFEKQQQFLLFINFNCYDTVYKRYRFEFLDYLKSTL